jgi:RNA polymerase sigma-70 factor (ECF subfamily)
LSPKKEIILVEAARNGHLESFGLLYERYYSSMVALAYSMLSDRELAEDAAQEVFAIACRDIGNLKSKEKFAAWLAGICRNISRQTLRTKERGIESITDEPTDKNNHLEYRNEMLYRAVHKLQSAERELILLRYYDNMPYERIAQILDISIQAVNGRLIRTKRKIAEYLRRNGFTEDDYE